MMTSPNWPWPPDCFLWRPCCRDGLADGFAIADRRGVGLHIHTVPPLEARKYGVQMLLVDALQADLVVGFVMLDESAAILLEQALHAPDSFTSSLRSAGSMAIAQLRAG